MRQSRGSRDDEKKKFGEGEAKKGGEWNRKRKSMFRRTGAGGVDNFQEASRARLPILGGWVKGGVLRRWEIPKKNKVGESVIFIMLYG